MSLAALDVRRRPDHRGELGSQLLMGEVVRLHSAARNGLWWRIENETDGYRGWARSWGLIRVPAARAARWRIRATARVVRSYAEATATRGGGGLVTPLFLNSRLIPLGHRSGRRRLELPDGRRAWVPAASVVIGPGTGPGLLARVRGLLGVPYLWGGRTALGLDCSGFTQQVLAEQGFRLPRDAWQQFRGTKALRNGEAARPGDLYFFAARGERPSHVGLALGGGYYAHARGRVMISSVTTGNPLCDNALRRQIVAVHRPVLGPDQGSRGGGGPPLVT